MTNQANMNGQQKSRSIAKSAFCCLIGTLNEWQSNDVITPVILRFSLQKSIPSANFLLSLLICALIRVSNNTMMAVLGRHFSAEIPNTVTARRRLSYPKEAINRLFVTTVPGGNNRETLNREWSSDDTKLIESVIHAFDICMPDKQLTLTGLQNNQRSHKGPKCQLLSKQR